MNATRGTRCTSGWSCAIEARTPSCAGPSGVPAARTTAPFLMSSPRRRIFFRASRGFVIVTRFAPLAEAAVSSCRITVSAPRGTGAPVPRGADTVIRQEDTAASANGANRVTITNPRDARKNIRRLGEDIKKGAVVLAAGTPLGPAQLGVLASIAHDHPLVHRVPRVAFMGSGDEIVDLDRKDEILAARKIASSNSYTLDALIRRTAADPVNLGLARDTKESLREHLRGASVQHADLLVTTAGVSVGEHDLVRDVLQELGGELKMWRIAMRPGAPVGFGLLGGGGIPWIGLPGNPVSTMVTFELFVRPAIRRLQGHALPFRRTVAVIVRESITLGPKLRHYLRAIVDAGEARLTGPQGSGILTSMARANALLIVPADMPAVAAGTELEAL